MTARVAVAALGAAAIVVGSGCKRKSEESGRAVAAGSATPATPPTRIADRLIAEALARNPNMTINRLEIDYVAADGTLAPSYGELEITLQGPEPGPPPDDPKRPIGAPVPPPTTNRECRAESWVKGTWEPRNQYGQAMCFGSAAPRPLRCTVLAIWSRAIAEGAPRDALAKLGLMHGMGEGGGNEWDFSIEDAPRNISFRRSYPDDCDPTVEAPAR